MKYFTPKLFVRLQDVHDEAAIHDWERAARKYASSLTDVLPHLPTSLRQVLKEWPLHDADVLSMTRLKDTLSITLRPELSGELLVLSYTLIEAPTFNRAALPREHCTEQVLWLYDELGFELVSGPPSWLTAADRERGDGRATVCTHRILLSNGWEVALKFRKFKLSRPETFIPSFGPTAGDREEMLTRSA
ncbi:MAG TPA: hypothetical protein VKA46_02725 [Gemmataceae bacterium]|nr:hypothetical protein [Gemmataceae bacterium]